MKGALLIVFVLTHEASQPETRAFAAAAQEVLGDGAQVQMLTVPADLADSSVEAQATGADADGAIELSWSRDGTQAFVHCYITEEKRWVDRSIGFGKDDDERERGRLLGYAVASMFLGTDGEPAAESVPVPAKAPVTAAAPVETKAPVNGTAPSKATAPREATAPNEPAPEMPPNDAFSASPDAAYALDLAGMVSHGLGGEADAVGVTAAFRFLAVGPVWARIGVGGRGGEIPNAQANMKMLQGSVGAAWSFVDTGRFTATLRGDLIGSWLEVGHLSADDPQVAREQRWLFGTDAVLTGGFQLSASASLFAGGGIEVMFGKTDIYTHGFRVETIPPLRLIAELGLESVF